MSILLLDCEDSFTNNLYDYLSQLGTQVDIVHHSVVSIDELAIYQAIVLSPGPNAPNDLPILFKIIQVAEGKIPILGVCLGHQAIGIYYGHSLTKSSNPLHGISKRIILDKSSIFDGLNQENFWAMRYNSLTILDKENSPLEVLCRDENGEIMGMKHREHNIYSFQFHPESIGTPQGLALLYNWKQGIAINE